MSHSRMSLSGTFRACPFSSESSYILAHPSSRVSSLVSGPVQFSQIHDELWNPPPWINETKAAGRMIQTENDGTAKSGKLG